MNSQHPKILLKKYSISESAKSAKNEIRSNQLLCYYTLDVYCINVVLKHERIIIKRIKKPQYLYICMYLFKENDNKIS